MDKVKLGEMTLECFQYLCIEIIHSIVKSFDDKINEFHVNLIQPDTIRLDWAICKESEDKDEENEDVIATATLLVKYADGSVMVEIGEYWTDYGFSNKEMEKKVVSIQKALLIYLKKSYDARALSESKAEIYRYAFNPVTCLKVGGKVEHIRLTPEYFVSYLKENGEWGDGGGLYVGRKYELKASGDILEGRSENNEGDISSCKLANSAVWQEDWDLDEATWVPIPGVIADTALKINKPLFVKKLKDGVAEECGFWLYVTTAGIVLGDTVVVAPMRKMDMDAKDPDKKKESVLFFDDGKINVGINMALKNKNVLPIYVVRWDDEKENEDEDTLFVEVEREEELSNLPDGDEGVAALKSRISQLGETLYYDGSRFEPFYDEYTRASIQQDEWMENHPGKATALGCLHFLIGNIKAVIIVLFILISLISLIFA